MVFSPSTRLFIFIFSSSAVNVNVWQTVGGNEHWTERANEQMAQDVLTYILKFIYHSQFETARTWH